MGVSRTVEVSQTRARAANRVRSARSLRSARRTQEELVNDTHSQLNRTRVSSIVAPDSLEEVCAAIRCARSERRSVCIAGGRHAMGGQQFGTDALLLDMTRMNQILSFDAERAEVEVEAGTQWPELIGGLVDMQRGRPHQLGIIQKQTGADRLSLGGALAANIHGRGLSLKPIIGDVESFVIVDADGIASRCSRSENAELFRLAIGGYGLFGIVTRITLRLGARRKLERIVRIEKLEQLIPAFEERISEGFLYGDFQFMTDSTLPDFLSRGVFSCYRPVSDDTPTSLQHRELAPDDWRRLLLLAHADKKRAFDLYSEHYLSTNGQIYWSDTHQLSVYLDDYHRTLDSSLGADRGSEMITEVYVPREKLVDFMTTVGEDFRANSVDLIYGTIRLIEKDEESFMPWATDRSACIVFNLHVNHDRAGVDKAKSDFRRLIDRAISYGGSYYLTYHRWATREQVLACYPQFPDFLRLKLKRDPAETFQSDWYRHYRALLSGVQPISVVF
jgi:FAD/FMN-containing dehydrogenase